MDDVSRFHRYVPLICLIYIMLVNKKPMMYLRNMDDKYPHVATRQKYFHIFFSE